MLHLKDRIRARYITRFHTVHTNHKQSVASHSHAASIIVEALLDGVCRSAPTFEDRYYVLKYFQCHDLAELICGDLPSPYKRFLEINLPGFKALERKVEHALVPELVEVRAYFDAHPHLKVFCSLADIFEAYSFIADASGGNEHIDIVKQKLVEAIAKLTQSAAEELKGNDFNWGGVQTVFTDMIHGPSFILDFERNLNSIVLA